MLPMLWLMIRDAAANAEEGDDDDDDDDDADDDGGGGDDDDDGDDDNGGGDDDEYSATGCRGKSATCQPNKPKNTKNKLVKGVRVELTDLATAVMNIRLNAGKGGKDTIVTCDLGEID